MILANLGSVCLWSPSSTWVRVLVFAKQLRDMHQIVMYIRWGGTRALFNNHYLLLLLYFCIPSLPCGASLVTQRIKRLPAMRETRVRSLGWEDPLEKEMAIHSSTLAWRIPWTEEPGWLQSTGSQRVRHDWVTSLTHSLPYLVTVLSLFYGTQKA